MIKTGLIFQGCKGDERDFDVDLGHPSLWKPSRSGWSATRALKISFVFSLTK